MKSPVQLKHLLVAALATIAACDSNHDGDKGAVWGTDKQTDRGSEISGVNEAGHTKKKGDDDKTANGVTGENGYTGYYGGSHDRMDSTGQPGYGLQEAATDSTKGRSAKGATGSSGAKGLTGTH